MTHNPRSVRGACTTPNPQHANGPGVPVGFKADALGTDSAPIGSVTQVPDVTTEGLALHGFEHGPDSVSVLCGEPFEASEHGLWNVDAPHTPSLLPRCSNRRERRPHGLRRLHEFRPPLSAHRRAGFPDAARNVPPSDEQQPCWTCNPLYETGAGEASAMNAKRKDLQRWLEVREL